MQDLNQMNSDWGDDNERTVLLVTYVLHGFGAFTGITAFIALIINYIKIKETRSEMIRSHHRWMLRTFWWGLLWSAVCFVLYLVVVGVVGFFILWLWFLYRVIYGVINFIEHKPMPA
jgi:uncharacterized membrane protein